MIPKTEAELVEEYTQWLTDQRLPLASAEEVMMSGKCTKYQWEWLKDFIVRWEQTLHYFHIGRDFSRTPGARYRSEGKFSAEELREKLAQKLKGAIAGHEPFTVDLDGTSGYGTAFLEELFGGLIRSEGIQYQPLLRILVIKTEEEPYLFQEIQGYLKAAHDQSSNP